MKKSLNRISDADMLILPLVSHDIKSLSNAIMGVSQALSAKLNHSGIQDENYIRECVQLIHSASASMSPLIEDLVAIGKHQADSTQIKPLAVYNLREELECSCDTFSYEALAKNIELSLFVEAEIPVVYWDIESLRLHAVNNILSNAIRHTPVGGKIAITVCKSAEDTLAIKISDSGLGIPSSERESIFRRYLKSDKYRHLTGNKRGIGLHNAQRCVQAHKGIISVVDEAEFSGATFKIELPLFSACIQ